MVCLYKEKHLYYEMGMGTGSGGRWGAKRTYEDGTLLYGEAKQSGFLWHEEEPGPSCGSQAQCQGPSPLTKAASPEEIR